jgi:hypothetical protein
MPTFARVVGIAAAAAALLAAGAASAAAQDENALKSYFEGRRITLRLDMPGSADGVDIQVNPPKSIDYKKYRENVKRYGIAINYGDSSRVTLVKVKGSIIEFQIGGGGFGTFGDDTNTSSNIRLLEQTEREKTLEKRITDETDKHRKRALQRELNDLRDRRERENRLLRAESDRIEEAKRERIAEKRLQGGSRFNLRWSPKVPTTIKPEDIERALVEYVDFHNAPDSQDTRWTADELSLVRKGMPRQDVEVALGQPVERSDKREGGVDVTTLVFDVGDERLTASFVEDVLVRYTIASK